MPKRKRGSANEVSPVPERRSARTKNVLYEVDDSNDDYDELVMLPDPDDSGSDDNSDDEASNNDDKVIEFNDTLNKMSYTKVYNNYTENQKNLEPDHVYSWVEGEKVHSEEVKDSLFLTDNVKHMISKCTPVELFEMFFCMAIKNYIVEATKENGFDLSLLLLNAFIGIIIFSSFNKRKSQRDYWSNDPYLCSDVVKKTMSRKVFEKIKSKLKFSKKSDNNSNDRGWRVRFLIDQFRKNIQQFGFFRSGLSIDEMMVKSFARTVLKQFIRGKPIRFGIKLWGLATSDGYLLDFDLYCGKAATVGGILLSKCALGSRVVMYLLQKFLSAINIRKLSQYHLYFDNFFTSFDLILHLKKIGLRATGTIRDNRVKDKNNIDKKADRGTYAVKHDANSGINFVTVMDSKPVSIASTAGGVSPLTSCKRFSAEAKSKIELMFPKVFEIYNKYMGGVDLHDMHCNNLLPCIRSKKWTWVIFVRIIQSSITNAVVLYNAARENQKKVGTKEFALSIAKHYMEKAQNLKKQESHKMGRESIQRSCSLGNCKIRTYLVCEKCQIYLCQNCFTKHLE